MSNPEIHQVREQVQLLLAKIEQMEFNNSPRLMTRYEKEQMVKSVRSKTSNGRDRNTTAPRTYILILRSLAECGEGEVVSTKELDDLTFTSPQTVRDAMSIACTLGHAEIMSGEGTIATYKMTEKGRNFIPRREHVTHA